MGGPPAGGKDVLMGERKNSQSEDANKLDTVQVFHALDPKQV